MRKLYEQDIIEILYGATLLGAGGGGSLKQGLDMIQGLKDDGEQIELDLLDVSEMRDDAYAVMVAGLGSPVAMLDPDMPRFGPDAVFAYRAFQKAFAAEGKKLEYLYSGEMGGFNTFTPMLVAILSDKDPAKRIKFVDADGNGRAVPEQNTTSNAFYDHPPKPMGMGSLYGDEIIVYPTTDHSGEQMCLMGIQSSDLGLPATVAISRAYGKRGSSFLVSLVIAVCMIGWFAAQTSLCASSFCNIMSVYFHVNFPLWLSVIIWGCLMFITSVYGVTIIEFLNKVSVPALFVMLIWGVISCLMKGAVATVSAYEPPAFLGWTYGITLAVAGFASGAICCGDYTRYCKSRKDTILSSVVGVLPVRGVLQLWSAHRGYAGTDSGHMDHQHRQRL